MLVDLMGVDELLPVDKEECLNEQKAQEEYPTLPKSYAYPVLAFFFAFGFQAWLIKKKGKKS